MNKGFIRGQAMAALLAIAYLALGGCGEKDGSGDGDFFNESLVCPAPAVAEFEAWGKSGSQQICKIQHGPFVAWESGYIHVRGRYDFGKKAGVWNWFDENGKVVKRIDYSNTAEAVEVGQSK